MPKRGIPRGLGRRERLVEAAVGGAFLVAAVALALLVPTDRPLDWTDAALATLVLALASCVVFEVGSCYTMPTQVAFVPKVVVALIRERSGWDEPVLALGNP